jgi:hypothetical protein
MKKLTSMLALGLLLLPVGAVADVTISAPYNPATGIWIQQVGDLYPSTATNATVYYTRYADVSDRVKSVDYYYDGNGYLKLSNKNSICYSYGADGIVHHPDGDLMVAGQANSYINKVSRTVGYSASNHNCVVKMVTGNIPSGSNATLGDDDAETGNFHLMMDYTNKYLWASGQPGPIVKINTGSAYDKDIQDAGTSVTLYGATTVLSTLIWDDAGHAFFTRSGWRGGGCEDCSDTNSTTAKLYRSRAFFGRIDDTTYTSTGEFAKFHTVKLIDSLEGAHGGAYDSYSKTIFIFGGSRILQIDVSDIDHPKVIATVDLNKYFFNASQLTGPRTSGVNGWRLDQGSVDGKGHLFVASNTGHLIFIDYTSNPNKRIDNNILIHMQWIDDNLDDMAPLSGAGSPRSSTTTNTGYDEYSSSSAGSSSSLKIYVESSSSAAVSSSGAVTSSSMSSGSTGNSSGSIGNSSGSTGNSSGSIGNSSGSTGNSSGSTGNSSGSTGSGDDSSNSTGSSGSTGGGEDTSSNSTGSSASGGGEDVPGWVNSSNSYSGFEDYTEGSSGSASDLYPTQEKHDMGDTLVVSGSLVTPSSATSGGTGTVIINGNTYLTNGSASSTVLPSYADDSTGALKDTLNVGDVVQITLSAEELAKYFGVGDTVKISGSYGLQFVDPSNPASASDSLSFVVGTDSVNIWVTATTTVLNGNIYFTDAAGHFVIFGGLVFENNIPDIDIAFIKDSNGNDSLDAVEIVLADTIPANLSVKGMSLVVNGDTVAVKSTPKVTSSGTRITADVSDLSLPLVGDFPDDALVLVTYTDPATGTDYVRSAKLVEAGGHVIKSAYAIRNASGDDSLFVEFNIDVMPADIANKNLIIYLNGAGFSVDKVSSIAMPTKNMIILVGEDLGLKGKSGDSTDYVTLAPGATFTNLPYMTSDEYDRNVPVTVTDRIPGLKTVEYYDTDGDGVLDSIVVVFKDDVTEAEKELMHFTFPWYSSRGLLIDLEAQPANLVIDAKDPSRVGWSVQSNTTLKSGLTSVSSSLSATLYIYYDVLSNTFVSEQTSAIEDKMAPVITMASLHYGEDSKKDTLTVTFSEAVKQTSLIGTDFFQYIHGTDTLDLTPSQIIWSADGKTAQLILRESTESIIPGDSLMIVPGTVSSIEDIYGNKSGDAPSPVVIAGLLSHLVQTVDMGSFDPENDTLQTMSSVSLSYLPGTTRTADMRENGQLGHLISLGQRFVPQLIDNAQVDANGNYDASVLDSLDPQKVFITFSVSYFDNLGQYVTDTTLTIPCTSPKFGGGNCLTTDKKVFVGWNYKDRSGRFVGTGVYIVQFKLVVRYDKKKIEEEQKDKWGVRRRHNK